MTRRREKNFVTKNDAATRRLISARDDERRGWRWENGERVCMTCTTRFAATHHHYMDEDEVTAAKRIAIEAEIAAMNAHVETHREEA